MQKLSLLAAGLTLVACGRADDPTPTGSNTFTCQIEGKDFSPYLAPVLVTPQKALQATRYQRGLYIEARTSFDDLALVLPNVRATDTYSFGNRKPYYTPRSSYAAYIYQPPLPGSGVAQPATTYYTDSLATGTITLIRYDTVARVAGGTFQYTAREATTGKQVHITNGHFDVLF